MSCVKTTFTKTSSIAFARHVPKLHKTHNHITFNPRSSRVRVALPNVPAEVDSSTTTTTTIELTEEKKNINKLLSKPYKWGFKTLIDSETFPKGISEDVVRAISAKKNEPEWLLEFRLKAFKKWLTMSEPNWSINKYN